MEKKEKTKEVTPEKAVVASDEEWTKHREERQRHTNENADWEIANMNHSDFSTLLQEIEHH